MKKVLLLVLCIVLAGALLVGCDSSGDDAIDVDSSEAGYKVGITQIVSHPALDSTREGFIAGLAEEGIVEGENLTIIEENAQGEVGTAQQIAQNFVSQNVDLIFAIATPSAQAAQNAAFESDTPVIFGAISDPVGAELSNEDGSGIGNITGLSDKLPVDPQLRMIRDILPDAETIGIIYNTGEDNSRSTLEDVKEAAPGLGFTVEELGVTANSEVPGAVDAILAKNVDALYIMTDNTVVSMLAELLDKTDAAGVPVFGSEDSQVAKGAIATEGIDYFSLGREAGKMAAQVLKGEKEARDIPFVVYTNYAPAINIAAAEVLGIELPESVLNNALETFTTLDR